MVKRERSLEREGEKRKPSLEEMIAQAGAFEVRPEFVEHATVEIMKRFQEKGLTMHEDITNDIYNQYWGQLIVRRESPEKLIDAILHDKDIEIGFDPAKFGDKYLNCAVWAHGEDAGMRNAFLEGFSRMKGIVMIEAFKPNPDMKVEELSKAIKFLPGAKGTEVIDRTRCRAAEGRIHPEDMRFVILQVEVQHFPEDQLTEKELERLAEYEEAVERGERPPEEPGKKYVWRGFTFEEVQEETRAMAAK